VAKFHHERATVNVANGVYTLQASMAALHANAKTARETDWVQIAALYTALRELSELTVDP
jgi:predicted RNA polymerase sigma factor